MLYLEDVDGDATTISPACPLGVLWDWLTFEYMEDSRSGRPCLPVFESLHNVLNLSSRTIGLAGLPSATPPCREIVSKPLGQRSAALEDIA